MEPQEWPLKILSANILATYTTLILELHTSASRIATMHVCQLLYQEFDVRTAYVYTYTARSTWQP